VDLIPAELQKEGRGQLDEHWRASKNN